MPFSRFTIRIGLAILAVGVVWSAVWLFRVVTYGNEWRAAKELVTQLRDRQPPDVDDETWELASGWAGTAFCNVIFTPSSVPLDELKRFRAELEGKVLGNVDLATIDWVWARLGQTGPQGKDYCGRFIVMYHADLERLRAQRKK